MYRKLSLLLCLCLLLALAGTAKAKDKAADKGTAEKGTADKSAQEKAPSTKQLSGMSIVGNDEAPKALYIVPWKRSEIGAETSLSKMLTESAVPVDREEFMRQLDLYDISAKK